MSIQFKFHPEKAVEAAALLLKLHSKHGKPMKYLGLLKMLYIADRIALERMEQPITGDHYVSMNYGPVLSGVYDLIKGQPVDHALTLWSQYISSQKDHYVSLLAFPGDENLCEEEEEIIQQVYQDFGHLDPFDVAEWTHGLPEWQYPDGSAIPISIEEILKNVGKSDEEIVEIQQEAIREAYIDEVLNG
ncbi:MAG: Panacea domain-containing protein [Microcoleaceae cyanobacterium]